MTDTKDVWFRYRATPRGKLVWPVSAKGWVSVLGITVGPTLLFIVIAQILHLRSSWALWGYLTVAIPIMVVVLHRLFSAKGQQY
jgi:hypothetical protein